MLGAHQENGVNLTSIFMRSVFAYETGRILHNILYQARVPNPFADEVVKDVFREHAEHDLSGGHVEEKQRLRSENEDMKQKRKKDLAVIQGLRKEVKELKSQARAKLSSTSQSRNGSKTSGERQHLFRMLISTIADELLPIKHLIDFSNYSQRIDCIYSLDHRFGDSNKVFTVNHRTTHGAKSRIERYSAKREGGEW